jgi:pimeloyl-ACP methyl ester carboxylesterase
MTRLHRATVDGVELAYETRGSGEPVVLIHAGIFADWNTPLLEQPALTTRYRVLSYHRAGSGGSGPVAGPLSVMREAEHCRALLRHLGIERAHVVGHSNGGMVALQLAMDAPEAVQTLALLESARPGLPDAPQEQEFVNTYFVPAVRRYQAADAAGAVDLWMRGVAGADYRTAIEQVLPATFERSIADAGTFFAQQLPAVREWSFTPEDAGRITQPALVVLGEHSTRITPTFGPRQQLLLSWLPNAEGFTLPGATHLLHVQNPRGLAEALAAFFTRHPIATAA